MQKFRATIWSYWKKNFQNEKNKCEKNTTIYQINEIYKYTSTTVLPTISLTTLTTV